MLSDAFRSRRNSTTFATLTPETFLELVRSRVAPAVQAVIDAHLDTLQALAADVLLAERARRRELAIDEQRQKEALKGRRTQRAGEEVEEFAAVEEAKAAVLQMAQQLADLPPPSPKFPDDMGFSPTTDTAMRQFLAVASSASADYPPLRDWLSAARLLIVHSKTQLPRARVMGAVRALEAALPAEEPLPERPTRPTAADYAIVDPRKGEGRDAGVGTVGWTWDGGGQVTAQIPDAIAGAVLSGLQARGYKAARVFRGESARYQIPLAATALAADLMRAAGAEQGAARFGAAARTWTAKAAEQATVAPAPLAAPGGAAPAVPANGPTPMGPEPADLAEGYATTIRKGEPNFFTDYVRWSWDGGPMVALALGMVERKARPDLMAVEESPGGARMNGWGGRGRGGGGPRKEWEPANQVLQAEMTRRGKRHSPGEKKPKLDRSGYTDYFTLYPVQDIPLAADLIAVIYDGDQTARDALRERAPWWVAKANLAAAPADAPTVAGEATARKGSAGQVSWEYSLENEGVTLSFPYVETTVSVTDEAGNPTSTRLRGVGMLTRHAQIPHSPGGAQGYDPIMRADNAARLFDVLERQGLFLRELPTLRAQIPYWKAIEAENAPKASAAQIQRARLVLRMLRHHTSPEINEELLRNIDTFAAYLDRVHPGDRRANMGAWGSWQAVTEIKPVRGRETLSGQIHLFLTGLGPEVEKLGPVHRVTVPGVPGGRWARVIPLTEASVLADALDRAGALPLALSLRVALLSEGIKPACAVQDALASAYRIEEVQNPDARALISDTTARFTPRLRPGIKVRDYQAIGAAFARSNQYRALIADEMGIGKTLQAILALASDPERLLPALVVAPASVVPKWPDEIGKFTQGIRARAILAGEGGKGAAAVTKEALADSTWDVLVVGWALLALPEPAKLLKEAAERGRFRSVVYDEVHQAKNPGAARSKTAKEIAHAVQGGRIFLSGTPMENTATEIWHPLHMMNPVAYSDLAEFTDRFGGGSSKGVVFQVDPRTGERVRVTFTIPSRPQGPPDEARLVKLAELKDALRCDMVLRKKADVLPELPPQERLFDKIQLSPAVGEAYADAEDRLPGWVCSKLRRNLAIQAAERMKIAGMEGRTLGPEEALWEIVSTALTEENPERSEENWIKATRARAVVYLMIAYGYFRRFIGVAKAPRVVEIVSDYLDNAGGKPTVVFAEHQKPIEIIVDGLQKAGKRVAVIVGQTPPRERAAIVRAYQQDRAYDVIVASQALREGVDLTRADVLFFAEQWLNPQKIAQAEARIHRADDLTLGKKSVTYRHLHVPGTVDQDVIDLLDAKRREVSAVLGGERVTVEGTEEVEPTKFLSGVLAAVGEGVARKSDMQDTGDDSGFLGCLPTAAQILAAGQGKLPPDQDITLGGVRLSVAGTDEDEA